MSASSVRSAGSVVPAAALGGLLYGLLDAGRAALADTLQPEVGRLALLAALDAGALALVGAVVALPLWLLLRSGLGRRVPQPASLGLLAGLGAPFLLDLGEGWFKAPPPFTQAPPLHGNPLVFAAAVAVVLVLVLAAGVVRARAVGLGLAALAVVGLGGRAVAGRRAVEAGGEAPPAGARNVLLVTMDTARADYFGAYGRDDVQTPHFDGLAAEGVRFQNAFSQIPVTGPSHKTIMTGVPPWEHGNLLNGLPVDPRFPLLAEQLRARGWRTGAFVSAYVLDGSLGFSRGFQVYDDDFGWLQGWDATVPGRLRAMVQRITNPDLVLERIGGRTTDEALAWLDANGTGPAPFFAWVHLFDPHGPYTPPPPWDTAYYQGDPRDPGHTSMQSAEHIAAYLLPSLRGITDADYVLAQYAGEVSYTDAQVGRLLSWLEQSGRADDTLVILVGDHGESLAGEHGVWFNHGDDLYEASTWIPWAMRLPGGAHAGTVVDDTVELTDLAPTVYEVLGLQGPAQITGQSVLPAIQGQAHRPYARGVCFDRPINQELRRAGEIKDPVYRISALRFPTSRFVDHEHERLSSENWGVTGTDPFRVEQRAPIAIPVENQLTGLTQALFTQGAIDRSTVEQSAEAIEKLQALGYMEE